MDARDIDRIHREQVAEQNTVLVDRLGMIGGNTPVGRQPVVVNRLRRGEHSEHCIRISNIQNKKQVWPQPAAYHSFRERTVPLSTVRSPSSVLTCKKPCASSPSVMP